MVIFVLQILGLYTLFKKVKKCKKCRFGDINRDLVGGLGSTYEGVERHTHKPTSNWHTHVSHTQFSAHTQSQEGCVSDIMNQLTRNTTVYGGQQHIHTKLSCSSNNLEVMEIKEHQIQIIEN